MLQELLLAFILSLLFGINNASVCQAGIVSSGLFTFKKAGTIIGLGLVLGSLLEGWKTRNFIIGTGLTHSSLILVISVFVLFMFTIYKIPVSVAHVVAGGWLGATFGVYRTANVVIGLVLAWSLTPFLSLIMAILLYVGLKHLVKSWSLPRVVWFSRIALLLASFYTSYTLGSNNIGLIMGVAELATSFFIIIVAGILVGALFLSKGFVKAIGEDFLVVGPLGVLSSLISGSFIVWVLTQLGYPGSLTNGILGALIGIGLVSKPRVFNVSRLYGIVSSWIFGGIIGFSLSLLAVQVL